MPVSHKSQVGDQERSWELYYQRIDFYEEKKKTLKLAGYSGGL